MFLKGISEIKRIMNGYYFPLIIELRTLDKNLFHFCFLSLLASMSKRQSTKCDIKNLDLLEPNNDPNLNTFIVTFNYLVLNNYSSWQMIIRLSDSNLHQAHPLILLSIRQWVKQIVPTPIKMRKRNANRWEIL